MADADPLSQGLTRKGAWLVAAIFFVIAMGFRLSGITWGLPSEVHHQSYHPDELLIKQYADLTPYFRPGFYSYGTFYLTVLKLSADAGRTYGWVRQGDNIPQWQTDRDIHLTGRIISAISGSLTVAFIFLALLYFTGVFGAAVGAVVMLLAPGHVVHSRFQTTDVFATMLIAAAMLAIIKFLNSPLKQTNKLILGAGILAGLAAGTKYSGILLIPSLLIALILHSESKLKAIALAMGGFAAGFLIATPGALLEPSAFWAGFTYELSHTAEGHGIVFAETGNGAAYHLKNLMEAFGFVPFLAGVAGLVWAAIGKEKWALVMVVFAILYFAVIARAEVRFLRYVFPLLPLLALGAGSLVGALHLRGLPGRVAAGIIVLLIGYSAVLPMGAAQLTALMHSKDPRDQAADWLSKKTGDIGLVSDPWFYTPPFFANGGLLSPFDRLASMKENSRLQRFIAPDGSRKDWDVRLLDEVRPKYIVFSSFEFLDNDRINQPDMVAFIRKMSDTYGFAGVFWGAAPVISNNDEPISRELIRKVMLNHYPITHDMMYIQPTICVFERK